MEKKMETLGILQGFYRGFRGFRGFRSLGFMGAGWGPHLELAKHRSALQNSLNFCSTVVQLQACSASHLEKQP